MINRMGIQFSSRLRRGFTALEVTAVAAIIAIMALILIPIMRNRVEDAKIIAAQDDMSSIEKAETLAFADTGRYFRLQDMTHPSADPAVLANPAAVGYARELQRPPQAQWNRALNSTEITLVARSWRGAQLALHRTQPIATLIAQAPYLFTQVDPVPGAVTPSGGPILFLTGPGTATGDHGDVYVATQAGLDTTIPYPVDPWGNPYIFFGPGIVADPQVLTGAEGGLNPDLPPRTLPSPQIGTETFANYGTAAVYSLGPDGRPGVAATITDPLNYYRETGALGDPAGDDIVRQF